MKTKLFLDFDGTIFDTSGYYKKVMSEPFYKAGFDPDEVSSSYKAECLDYKYSPFGQLDRLKKIKDFNLQLAESRIRNGFEKIKSFVFPDAITFLGKIDREKYEVNLLTLGDIEFQGLKVENSGLAELFDNIYVTDKQKWDYLPNLVDENEKFVIIDDRGDTAEKVAKKFRHSMPIEINRIEEDGDPMEMSNGFSGIRVKNLIQAAKYL